MKPKDMTNLVMVFQIEELVSESQLPVSIEAIKVDSKIEDQHQMLILTELQQLSSRPQRRHVNHIKNDQKFYQLLIIHLQKNEF
jgi:hypothetical protein